MMLPILSRYILREFLKLFGLGAAALLTLSLLVEFFERIDDFLEHKAELSFVIEYFLLFIPRIFIYTIPIATLIATLLTIGILSRNSELVAMRAAGISLYSVATPILVLALGLSLFSFIANETVVPQVNRRLDYVKNVKIKKKPRMAFYQQNKVWIQDSENTILNIGLIPPEGNKFYEVTLYKLDQDFRLIERIDAREISWSGEGWVFSDGSRKTFSPEGGMNNEAFQEIHYKLSKRPEDIRVIEKRSEEMNILEIYRHAKRLKETGYRTTRYVVDMHSKISFAFVSFVMALFGIPFAFRGGRSEGIVIGIGASILIAFLYWIVFSSGISLGRAEVFPPLLAAWIGNLLFGASGIYMLLSVKQ